MKRNIILLLIAAGIFAVAIHRFNPNSLPVLGNRGYITGILEDAYESGDSDISIRLVNNPNVYYVDNGMNKNISIENIQLQKEQEVTITYKKYWNSITARAHEITKIEGNGYIFFDESSTAQ